MKYLIIGAGPAGVVAAENLAQVEPGAEVTILGDEPGPPYSRMAIPYYLEGNIQESGTHLRKDPDHYASRGIRVLQARVQRVDPEGHVVELDNGHSLPYHKLLIATGSSPIRPDLPGMDLPGVQGCWTLDDARRIATVAKPGARVVLIGAGFIGSIILESLVRRGVALTVVEAGDRMVPRMMSQQAGTLIRRWCEAAGVAVRVDAKVSAILQGNGAAPLRVSLGDGTYLDADLVITAVGVRPNTGFLQGTGIAGPRGIEVDPYLRSPVPDVYAAGDVAASPDFSTGARSVHAIQPTAVEHGRIAALNMAGQEARYRGSLIMNVLDTVGLISSSFGLWMGTESGQGVELHDPDAYKYLSLQFEGDRLVGAITVGHTEHIGALRGLIQSRVRLGQWKERLLANPTRLMEAYLQVFSPHFSPSPHSTQPQSRPVG